MKFSQLDLVRESNVKEFVAQLVVAETRRILAAQMQEFVSRGLVEVEYGEPTMIQRDVSNFEFVTPVTLKLKNAEYIEKLEHENADLKDRIVEIKEALAERHER